MPITTLNRDKVQHACSHCGATRTIAMQDMKVGIVRDGEANPSIVALPACTNCGSVEYLLQSQGSPQAHPSPGSYGHKHRLLVDSLHATLVRKNKLAKGLKKNEVILAEPPADLMQKLFPKGLKLPIPTPK